MSLTPDDLRNDPNPLAKHYTRFRVGERLLFTGHSHQAWPDCGFEGQQQAWMDAAQLVDEKWGRAYAKQERVREGYAAMFDDSTGVYGLSTSTHDLLVRFLSAIELRKRPRIVTTDGEFHTVRRQLDRFEQEGLEIVRVPSADPSRVGERLVEAVDERTATVIVSGVFYQTAYIVPGLNVVADACKRVGAELLVDAYHVADAIPYPLHELGLADAFVVGGGYKYCQLGEGNAFIRFPEGRELRPIITGWFSEFSAKEALKKPGEVAYGGGGDVFAGATYDPTSHYRAASVLDFFLDNGLTPTFLRRVSQHQVGRLAEKFDALDANPRVITRDRDVPLTSIAGFLALRTPRAGDFSAELLRRGVSTDYRADILRIGPAPYHSDRQLDDCIGVLSDVIRDLAT